MPLADVHEVDLVVMTSVCDDDRPAIDARQSAEDVSACLASAMGRGRS